MSYIRNKTNNVTWVYFASRDYGGASTQTAGSISCIETTSGSAVPKYRSVIKSGNDATSTYSRLSMLQVDQRTPFSAVVSRVGNPATGVIHKETVVGEWFPLLPSGGSLDFSDARTRALTRITSRLSGQQSTANGMQFLAELNQVIRMLRRPYSGITQLLDRFSVQVRRYRGRYLTSVRVPNTRQFVRNVGSAWLETSFGLMPLMSDVKDLSETAARLATDQSRKRERVTGEATTQSGGQQTETITAVTGMNNSRLRFRANSSFEQRVRFVAALDWSRTAAVGSLGRVAELSGFRPDLFIPTLYELVPWSWAIDYVSNLGDVIESGCQCQSMVKWCVESSMWTSKASYTSSVEPINPIDAWVNGTPGRGEIVRKSFVRSPSTTRIPQVPLQLSLPGRPTQYLNVLAVIGQRIRG